METEVLRWFQQVADGATVTEVADLWMVSQPKVSRDLMALQREVGAPLLVKSGRVLRLTHAGAVFKKHVDAIVNRLDDALADVDQLIERGECRGSGHSEGGNDVVRPEGAGVPRVVEDRLCARAVARLALGHTHFPHPP